MKANMRQCEVDIFHLMISIQRCRTGRMHQLLFRSEHKQEQKPDAGWDVWTCCVVWWMLFFFFPLFPDCKRSCSPVGLPPPKRNPPHVGAGQAPAWLWRTSKYSLLLVGGAVGVVHLRRMSHPVLVLFLGHQRVGGQGSGSPRRPQCVALSLSCWSEFGWKWNQSWSLRIVVNSDQ